MPTMTQTVKFPVVLGLLANVLCILPASVDAQQQPAPGAPGYTRIQGQDGGALPLPAINTLRALTDHREEMRKLIEGISTYARQQKNGFMVVARDAEELIIKRDLQDDKIVSPARTFMRSIDGVLYDGVFLGHKAIGQAPPPEIQNRLLANIDRARKSGLTVMTMDFATAPQSIDAIYKAARERGMIAAVAHRPSTDLIEIPPYPHRPNNENSNNILALGDVKNFVYLSATRLRLAGKTSLP
jgi:hypothetical protein